MTFNRFTDFVVCCPSSYYLELICSLHWKGIVKIDWYEWPVKNKFLLDLFEH